MRHRFGWALMGALALVAVLALARAINAGPLDPPGPVGSTMRTLDSLLPAWDRTLSSTGGCTSQRFQCVMGNQAVLDRETGLVWDRTPGGPSLDYEEATFACGSAPIAGRYGWRLPTLTEIYSLADDSADDNLPDGNPFTDPSGGPYFTSTLHPQDDQMVLSLVLFGGFIEELTKGRYGGGQFDNAEAWCVRGGQSLVEDAPANEQPAWSRQLDATGGCASQRFECVLNGTAVLDRETGLVWELAPAATLGNYNIAINRCIEANTGGRRGWRLPTYPEASSLIDPAIQGLPAGHPFDIDPSLTEELFATNSTFLSTGSYIPFTLSGGFGNFSKAGNTSVAAWCVRGAGGEYAY